MGDTGEKESTAVSTLWFRRGAIVLAVAAAFWLGWLVATRRGASTAGVNPVNTTADAASPASQVSLQLDAGDLTLLPDASLHLEPLPTLDPDALYRESLQAGDAGSVPDAGPAATPPSP